MSDYRFQITKHNGMECLHVMIDAEPIAETHIPLDDIQVAMGKSYAQMVIESTAKLFEDASQGTTSSEQVSVIDYDIVRRLEALEYQLSDQGINDLAKAIEQRIISRMRYGRNPIIEKNS